MRTNQIKRNSRPQSGMVSQMLLFIILILLANAAVFAPNIATLKESRQAQVTETQAKTLSVLAAQVARGAKDIDANDLYQIPASANTNEGTIAMNKVGALPSNIMQITNMQVGYCPYYIGKAPPAGYMNKSLIIADTPEQEETGGTDPGGSTNPGGSGGPGGNVSPTYDDGTDTGNTSKNAIRPGTAIIEQTPDARYADTVLFSLILKSGVTCEDALAHSYSDEEVLNIKYGTVKALMRSATTEGTSLTQTGCPAGEEMVYTTNAQNQGTFECRKNVYGFAFLPQSGVSECGSGNAITPKAADGAGMDCAQIQSFQVAPVAQTVDTTRVNATTHDPTQITLFKPDKYFINARPLGQGQSDPATMVGLSKFDCPARYEETGASPSGTKSKFVVVLDDYTVLCVKAWDLLLTRNGSNSASGPAFCPSGKKIIWRPNDNGGRTFQCEGYAANDPQYGSYTVCPNDGNGQLFGYSPETNQIYCYTANNPAPQYDSTYTYVQRGTANCTSGGVLTLKTESAAGGGDDDIIFGGGGSPATSGPQVASCDNAIQAKFNADIRLIGNYHNNWALNWNPTTRYLSGISPTAGSGGGVTVPGGGSSTGGGTVRNGGLGGGSN